MWKVAWSCCACIGAVGCVSSGTWSSFGAIERELEVDERVLASARAAPREASSCAELAARVVDTSPRLRAQHHRARASLARGRSEGALPPPELTVEVWDFPIGAPQRADQEGMYMVGVAQEFPPAAALDARARAAAEEAREVLGQRSDQRRELRTRALQACIEWSASRLEIARHREAEALATQMREAMLAQIRSAAAASLTDIARVEGELARSRRMRVDSEARAARAAALLNVWLRTDEERRLTMPPPIEIALVSTEDLDRAVSRALEQRGVVQAARARARAAGERAEAAEAEATIPTFTVRATYMQTPSMRPGLGAAVGVSLPWLWSGEGAARDAARAEEQAALDDIAAIELEVRAEVAAAAVYVQAALRALEELRERERPAVRRALDAVTVGMSTGSVDLSAWLDAARALRELDVEEAHLLREAAIAVSELEGALGAPVARESSR